jgi:hypothetical protein
LTRPSAVIDVVHLRHDAHRGVARRGDDARRVPRAAARTGFDDQLRHFQQALRHEARLSFAALIERPIDAAAEEHAVHPRAGRMTHQYDIHWLKTHGCLARSFGLTYVNCQ